MGKVFVGHDWAEAHHDIHVQDRDGRHLAAGRLPDGVAGVAQFHELIGAHVEEPADVVIATETDRGLFVTALVAAGYTVLAVNPLSTSRYRERHSTSGAKSDPGDAKVLAGLARTDAHNHRPIAGDSDLAEAVKAAPVNLFEAGSYGNHCGLAVSSPGWLIQTAVGRFGGVGGLRTNRSGWTA